ncbi:MULTISPECIES: ATP-binding domain-containing protein [unclassified Cyanobium]|uniref:ATP-binding domain-containing protein n=1 Tax=unclassified Cyanobium TaxID=2627006 RepID=UPI0020CE05B4|nr:MULTISPECIES: ATP-binding domain-containing protein [unclassified Cyanobium]MCP9859248.1 ATP-binding domain-containing protein [Cyanobium sp. Cruz-8H5]MCP9866726.1 ATP-binding domain-containing protein [Cyanobium sp. Cruz-8D1]
MIEHLRGQAAYRQQQAKRLTELSRSDASRADALEDSLVLVLTRLQPSATRFSFPNHELTSRKSQAVEIDDEDALDSQWLSFTTTSKPDKAAIKEALKAGREITGVQLISRRFGWRFAPADKVMQVANDYEKEVFNGDVGTVETIDADASELTVRFDGREVTYGWGELDNLVPAYACTIHKSQGSEYPTVVIPLLTQHYPMLQRNLVYTGITRGKQLVVLVGQKKALAMAVKNHLSRRRYTKLAEWLGPS